MKQDLLTPRDAEGPVGVIQQIRPALMHTIYHFRLWGMRINLVRILTYFRDDLGREVDVRSHGFAITAIRPSLRGDFDSARAGSAI